MNLIVVLLVLVLLFGLGGGATFSSWGGGAYERYGIGSIGIGGIILIAAVVLYLMRRL